MTAKHKMTPEQCRETTSIMLTAIHINRHHALMQWAQQNYERWKQWERQEIPDSMDWHVATVESAYWLALVEMLKERAQ